jgi:hypothetical protein
VAGTPTTPGSYTFTLRARDLSSPPQAATRTFTIDIGTFVITTPARLFDAVRGTSVLRTLGASGGVTPLTWRIVTGSLPPGMTLNTETGQIIGTPTALGTFAFTVEARDYTGRTATKNMTAAIVDMLQIQPTIPPAGLIGAPYNYCLERTGGIGPFRWTISFGTLPVGLALNTATGCITGTPSGPSGASFIEVRVEDSGTPPQRHSALRTLTISSGF